MNIVNKLTLRYMKLNKKRTLITIIGVIISAAMITGGVATLGISFMDLEKRQIISDEGEWHVIYKDIDNTQLQAIKNDKETKQIMLSRDLGCAILNKGQNKSRLICLFENIIKKALKNFLLN